MNLQAIGIDDIKAHGLWWCEGCGNLVWQRSVHEHFHTLFTFAVTTAAAVADATDDIPSLTAQNAAPPPSPLPPRHGPDAPVHLLGRGPWRCTLATCPSEPDPRSHHLLTALCVQRFHQATAPPAEDEQEEQEQAS